MYQASAMDVPSGYIELIRKNHNFRLLWVGQIICDLGDWFNLIASASLIADLTESGLAVGGLFMIRTLAPFLASPLGGVIADRFSRRAIIIISSFLRVPIVLGFLLVRDSSTVWLLYTLTALQLFVSGIFFLARTAILPDIIPTSDLGGATALTGGSFAAMLTIGSALGGLVSGFIGIYPAFVINGFTYFLATIIFMRIIIATQIAPDKGEISLQGALGDYLDGLRYTFNKRFLLAIVLHKSFGGLLLGSTFEIVQVAIAEKVFTIGEGGSTSLGLMFAFTGVGMGVGTLYMQRLVKDSLPALAWILTAGYLVGGLGLALTATLTSFWIALFGTFLRGMGNGIVYLFSTQLILRLIPTNVRGRVVSTEFAFSMLTAAVGAMLVGFFLDTTLGITGVAWIMAGITLLPAFLWSLWFLTGGLDTIVQQVERV
jgi:MFS family permease